MLQGLNVADTKTREYGNVRGYLQRHEEMKQIRAPYDVERQQICDYIFPRRTFQLTEETKQVGRPRRLVDPSAMIAHERCSATLYGFLLSPHSPFIRPELLERDFTYAEDSWADEVARRMHRYLSGTASTFRVQFSEDMDDMVAFGDSVMWQQPSPRGSTYLSVPNAQMCWSENELGQINEQYRCFSMSLRRAMEKWPDSQKLQDAGRKTNSPESLSVKLLHVVCPRPGGVAGDLREVKPWTDIIIYLDGQEVLETGGHDRNPYAIGRFKRRSGEAYGYGPGWTGLPLIKFSTAIMDSFARNAQLTAEPPLLSMMPRSQPFDRRPGALNYLNTLLAVGIRDPKDVIQRINVAGDFTIPAQLQKLIWQKLDQAFYIDWMTPGDGPQMTATEVLDRRDLRLRALGPLVARVEQEKLSQLADNTYTDMMRAKLLPRPPASLNGVLMGFFYMGPLAQAQRQGEVEGFQRFIAMATQLAQSDPIAGQMLKPEDSLRAIADAYGIQSRLLLSPEEIAAKREAQRQTGEMQESIASTEAASRALQAGGQGISNLAQVGLPGAKAA